MKIVIVGSGTSGLVTAITLRGYFPLWDISIISSKDIGIIGVGEGSTEHWRLNFQDKFNIPVLEMVQACRATHKYGIRFENWTNHTPTYFHSVSGGEWGRANFAANYAFCLENDKLLTNSMISHLHDNTILLNENNPHHAVNQFHFDTFKLNEYLTNICKSRNITFQEGTVSKINRNVENGFIESIDVDAVGSVHGDFFVDASGFRRVIMNNLIESEKDFVSYRKYVPCDSAAVFPTPQDESGEIRPYTRAVAMPNGWMWEIPTQDRRGNGYVFASDFCSDEQAVKEISEAHGRQIEPARIIKFKSGYHKTALIFNCVAVGISSSFVEPLEATAISTSIQQAKMLTSVLPTFSQASKSSVALYNKQYESLLENIITMVAMHYLSDRTDTEMWKAQQHVELPPILDYLLSIWKERLPEPYDVPIFGYELFHNAHFWHVAQGQGLLNKDLATIQLDAFAVRRDSAKHIANVKQVGLGSRIVKHHEIF